MGKEEDREQQRRFREQQQRQRDEQTQANLDAAASADETLRRYNAQQDREFEREFKAALGEGGVEELSAEIDFMDNDQVKQRIRDMQELMKRPNQRNKKKVIKIAKRNSAAIKKQRKVAKAKKGGCGVIAVALLGVGAATLAAAAYGAHEVVSALIH